MSVGENSDPRHVDASKVSGSAYVSVRLVADQDMVFLVSKRLPVATDFDARLQQPVKLLPLIPADQYSTTSTGGPAMLAVTVVVDPQGSGCPRPGRCP
ncbi:hypothetical protein F441_16759 [Phytophthora nicotianae CJ01A1]|uniref:Uncharacterized protein n=2 Tax=Phytophthora nicotianae TaxID=4792 RepID=W2KH31_PHYNI|nr:hypothetical protein L915_16444 [Phytophthora nicotianae]ETL30715.1 hypothetical protein L916_16343 [Phytophthora nicotianae]ETL83949.1 hypothetical protein L917_16167 [Phytophthora nicotianae]ETP06901.1 hypothetical protein F441_16759 [Phytophthora nicotianae CJ01A1]